MTDKIEKQLNFTCSACSATFQLLEIHHPANHSCSADCQEQWQALLSKHFQEHIILHLAHQEAEKDKEESHV